MAKLVRAITRDGAVLATALDSTDMVGRAEQIHHSSATVTAAMGRLLTAASMMGAALKNDRDTITLRIAGGGPAGSVIAVSDAFGNARVTVGNPLADLPLNEKGKLDVGGIIGRDGYLSVVRDSGTGEPQTGYSPIVSGEIGEDLTYCFSCCRAPMRRPSRKLRRIFPALRRFPQWYTTGSAHWGCCSRRCRDSSWR